MSRRTTLTITMALGLALVAGVGTVRAADTRGEAISTIRYLDFDQHLIVLNDGTELLATDPAVLDNVHAGEMVKVRFTQEGGRYVIDSIEPARAAEAPAASPAIREPSPYDQMHVGEGETTGALPIKNPAGPGGIEYGPAPHDGQLKGPEAP